ncbi:MAG TPA: PhnD/SsuA/transferrin family substrate-binding protein [Phototrophicaceae bacterium]|nr:PhnD/SsuA/transferrin family substrate-binding protein [Phototrophicaceae bacterium]
MALLMASCRRLPEAGPGTTPTITPTPRSTALPPVPTAIPVGATANPLHIVFVRPSSSASLGVSATESPDDSATEAPASTPEPAESVDSAVTDLQKALTTATKLAIKVDLVNSDAEALAALCASPQGTITAAWLNGLAYAAAYAQQCGSALLQVERASHSTGDQARIVVKSSAKFTAVGDLSGATFCRLGYTDLYSWIIPALMLKSGGVADSDLKSITDYSDPAKLLADVAGGKCDAAGIAGSQFDQIATSDERSGLRTLQQSVTIPYAVLVMPDQVPLGQQKQLSDALVKIAEGTQSAMIEPLLDQDKLDAISDSGLGQLRSFIASAGLDLAQAGT